MWEKSIIQANPKMNLTNGYLLRTKNGGSGITFSNFVLLGGANSTESNYKIGGIYLRSTSMMLMINGIQETSYRMQK